jgi:hypothetical protein
MGSIDNNSLPIEPTRRQRRFQFSLKSFFVLVTFLCLWLGYRAWHRYRAEQMVERHNSLIGVIARSVATPPDGTAFRFQQPQNEETILGRAGWPKGFDPSTAAEFNNNPRCRFDTESFLLDVSKLLTGPKPKRVVWDIASYYCSGLEELGLESAADFSGPSDADGTIAGVVRVSPTGDLQVFITVQLDQSDGTAHVVIVTLVDLFLKCPTLQLARRPTVEKNRSHRIAPDERRLVASTQKTLATIVRHKAVTAGRVLAHRNDGQGTHSANPGPNAQRPIIALMFVSRSKNA